MKTFFRSLRIKSVFTDSSISDPDKKRFLNVADYNYETAVKDFKSCILRIWTLNYSSCAFLTCLLKKFYLEKA